MPTQPCVYVLHPGVGAPVFFAMAADVGHAVNLAHALAEVFGARAWVADWVRIAHVPPTEFARQLQADRERIYEVVS